MTSPRINIHASCIVTAYAGETLGVPGDAGVLILGESGAGKSDLALRLIAMGAILVADDRCDLFVSSGALHAAAPRAIAGMIEARGVGIMHVAYQLEARIALVVRLAAPDSIIRLPEPASYRPPPSLDVPEQGLPREILLAPFEASAPTKVLVAASESVPR